jgi:hypothetical protein
MASELLKNKTLIQRLKEDKVPVFNFDLAGSALDYNIESIEEELLPKEKPQELFDERDRLRIESLEQSLQDNKPFLMDESVDFIKRENFSDGDRPVDIARRSIPFTEETFEKIDELLKDPKIKTYSDLGRALGLNIPEPTGVRGKKGPGTPLSKRSGLIKAYEKSRGKIPADRFKLGTAYARGQKKVEDVLKLQADGMSTNAIAQKLKMDRRNVRTIFQKFRPDAIKDPTPKADDPTTTIKTRASARRQKREQEAFKKVGEKTTNQTKKVIDRIKDKNADILKMSDAEILNDPKIKYSMNIDATGLKIGEPIKFNKYADLSDKEFVKKVKEKAKNKLFYTPEHISEVAKEKLNTAFPNNIVNAPGRMTSQIGLIKTYLRKNPDGEFAKQADEVLSKTGMQFKTGGTTFGVKENIVFDSKTNKSNIVENYFQDTKTTTAGKKKLTALQQLASGKNVGFDPILASKAGYQEFVKPAASIAKRGALTGADLLLSAGAGPIGLGVGALIETGQAMPELTRGNIKEAGRRTIIGSLLPESLVGSMQTDLLKLAETPEEKIAMKNFIDFEKDRKKYESSVTNLKYLENNPFEAEGIDLEPIRNKILERKADLEDRRDKVFFPEFGNIFANLVQRLDAQNVENLEGVLGSIVGKRGIDDREQIQQDIFSQAALGQEPFYGQAPVQMSPEELDEIYESGIMAMANGGRIGFADGPDDPSKRTFLKIMGGIASLPIVGKFFKSAKVAKVVPLKNTTTTMPEWFPQFVEKALAKGVSKKIDADLTEIEIPELPGVKVQAHDDGRILVEGKNAYNEPYEINYTPPGFELVDETTGKAVKTPGEFQANDTRYYRTGNPEEIDYDVDFDSVKDVDDILGGNATELEGFAKGTGKSKYTKGQKAVDEAEAAAEQDRYVGTEGRADVDEGPDIDLSDYED